MKEKNMIHTLVETYHIFKTTESSIFGIKLWNEGKITVKERCDKILSPMRPWLTKALKLFDKFEEHIVAANEINAYKWSNYYELYNCDGVYSNNLKYAINEIADYLNRNKNDLLPFVRNTYASIVEVTPDLLRHTEEQEKLDIGEKDLERYFNTMKKMLMQFKSLLKSGESVKQKYREQVYSSSARPIGKFLINITFGVVFVLAVLTLLDLFFTLNKYIGMNIWSKAVTCLFFFTIILTIINSSIIAAISFGIIGSIECPLNENNFGFANFASSTSLCATPNITFFSGLQHATLIPKEVVAENLEISKYTKIMVDILAHPNRFKKIVPPEPQLIEHFCNELKKFYECTQKSSDYLAPRRNILAKTGETTTKIWSDFDEYNAKVDNSTTVVTQIVDAYYERYVIDVAFHNRMIKRHMERTDFSCHPIYDEFPKIGDDICEEVDIRLDYSWIYLLITMLSCLFYLFIHFLVYRCRFGMAKEDVGGSPISPLSPGTLSPISPKSKEDKGKSDEKLVATPTV